MRYFFHGNFAELPSLCWGNNGSVMLEKGGKKYDKHLRSCRPSKLSKTYNIHFERTVSKTSCDPPIKDGNARFHLKGTVSVISWYT